MYSVTPQTRLKDIEIGQTIKVSNKSFVMLKRDNEYGFLWSSEKAFKQGKPWATMLSLNSTVEVV